MNVNLNRLTKFSSPLSKIVVLFLFVSLGAFLVPNLPFKNHLSHPVAIVIAIICSVFVSVYNPLLGIALFLFVALIFIQAPPPVEPWTDSHISPFDMIERLRRIEEQFNSRLSDLPTKTDPVNVSNILSEEEATQRLNLIKQAASKLVEIAGPSSDIGQKIINKQKELETSKEPIRKILVDAQSFMKDIQKDISLESFSSHAPAQAPAQPPSCGFRDNMHPARSDLSESQLLNEPPVAANPLTPQMGAQGTSSCPSGAFDMTSLGYPF